MEYLSFKFLHILIAIIAMGTSAGLGIVLELHGNHPTHGPFVLRAIHRLLVLVVIPGYLPIALAVLRKQITLLETAGPASVSYRRVSLLERLLGAGVGLVVVATLYLMVVKPGA